jgi:hypothetical protein
VIYISYTSSLYNVVLCSYMCDVIMCSSPAPDLVACVLASTTL